MGERPPEEYRFGGNPTRRGATILAATLSLVQPDRHYVVSVGDGLHGGLFANFEGSPRFRRSGLRQGAMPFTGSVCLCHTL